MVFTVFCCLFVKNIQNKVSAFFYSTKSLTNFENASSNRLPEACSGFLVLPVTQKVAPKAGCDPENCSESRP
jgi:hypothetical protein